MDLNLNFRKLAILSVVVIATALSATAQVKRNKRVVKKAPVTVASPTPAPTPEPRPEKPKKNDRPVSYEQKGTAGKAAKNYTPSYFYEFTRPGFLTSRILIEHDVNGKGQISFQKQDFDELMVDPIQLSTATLATINEALENLNFIESTTDYQYEKDLPQMGAVEFTLVKGDKKRTVKYNWTSDKDAKALMDEYRRIGNEYVWRFDLEVARENQPLESPRIVNAMESFVKRGEISDPPHLLPYLTEVSNDERLPLIARNHALRLIKDIEKRKK